VGLEVLDFSLGFLWFIFVL